MYDLVLGMVPCSNRLTACDLQSPEESARVTWLQHKKSVGTDQTKLSDVEARDTRQTYSGKIRQCKFAMGIRRVRNDI